MAQISRRKAKVALIFGAFKAQFLKRPAADTHFRCDDVAKLAALVDRAISTGTRVSDTARVVATAPAATGDTPVAEFELLVSLKRTD